jgi:NADH-quinone oxidoreductase subunit N
MIDNTILKLIAPEIFVTVMASVTLMAGVFTGKHQSTVAYVLSLITLITVGIITFNTMPIISQAIFDNAFIIDRFSCQLKLVMYAILAGIYVYSKLYMRQRDFASGEFYSLSLLSLLGMMLVISCGNYLTLYLGLELLVLPVYAMIVFVKNKTKYIEAAMKYFVIGSLGAGLLLFGISLVFGATGTIGFSGNVLDASLTPIMQMAMIFIVVGVALEFGAVPFHMWLPDVYEGSPTPVTMIVSTIPKIAIFALAYRLLTLSFTSISADWQQLFMIMGLLSIALGNVLGIAQPNLKRMLAYSTIGHVGFILLGLFAAPQEGYTATIFYTIVYAFMALAAFGMITRLTSSGFEADQIKDFRGLSKRDPWLAFIMMLVMLSLAGIPPLVGFYAKFLILQAVVAAGYPWIAALSLLFSVIGAFYYLRIVHLMYFEPADDTVDSNDSMSMTARVILSAHGLSLLLFGIFPAAVLYYCLVMLS